MPSRKIFIAVFLSSFSALAFEITLTRIFSISLWYHFAFMVISIAMLGIAASGTLLALYPKLKEISNIGGYSLLFGISIPVCYVASNQIPFDPVRLSWDVSQLFYISLYYITLSIPFIFTGLIIGTAFSGMSEQSGTVYGSDLSGAGLGSITVLLLMYVIPPESIVLVLSAVSLIAAFVIGNKKIKIASAFLIAINIFVTVSMPEIIRPRMSPYKGLRIALKYPGAEHIKTYLSPFSNIDVFKSPAARFAPGLSLVYLEPLPEQIGISTDGGDVNAITNANDRKSLKFLRYLPSALPYEINNSQSPPSYPLLTKEGQRGSDVLIIDPKGGLQALMADYYNTQNIAKVESNQLLIKIIKDDFKEFAGNIYSANTFSGLARTWLKSSESRFDIIDISLTGTTPSGLFGMAEDYRFTVEAFREYLKHLKPNGFLGISLFILPPPRTELRLLNTIIAAMEENNPPSPPFSKGGMGRLGRLAEERGFSEQVKIKDHRNHIAAIRSWGTINIFIKKTALSPKDIEKIKWFSKERRFDLIYYPEIKEEETNIYVKMPANEYFSAFMNLLHPESQKSFIDGYIFDIGPVYDIKPFFNYFLKLKNIKPTYEVMGKKWQYFIEEGYLLIAVFIQVLALSLFIILMPFPSLLKVKLKAGFIPYFAFIGIGFMFIEISLIQNMILTLGNPSYAAASVLTSILMGSATGSLLSQRFSILRSPYSALFLSVMAILFSLFIPPASNIISSFPLNIKIFLIFMMLFPIGIFMGIPFPFGLRILGERESRLIPMAWAVNGCSSILAPILTIMLAMEMGFRAVMWLGGGAYLLAFFMLKNSIAAEK